jgi:hypothetical protein
LFDSLRPINKEAIAVSEPEILFIGQIDEAVAYGNSGGAAARGFTRAETPDAALEYLRAGGAPPALIVLVQSRPGQFSAVAIDGLRRAAPLARVERLAGSWCEGEQRSGQPPAGCVNHYWHQWPPRFARQWQLARAGRCPDWGLPPTVTVDQRALRATEHSLPRGTGQVVICSRRAASAAALADVCALGGYGTLIVREDCQWHVAGARATVWDTTGEGLGDATSIRRILDAAPGTPLVAVVGFPRSED